jgi:hypothetical protein
MLLHSRFINLYKFSILAFLFLLPFKVVLAQSLMSKSVSINAKNQRLDNVLSEISHKAGFQFSYNGKVIPKDSSVTITANNQTVSATLNQLLGGKYEFEERRNYIIITPALLRLSFINTDVTTDNNNYSVSGIVVDVKTGERLMNTSVYEKEQLVSTLTDEHGYFKIKLRSSTINQVRLTASRVSYRDTSLNLLNTVVISKRSRGRTFQNDAKDVEATALGRLFMTTAQRIQSMNIQDFFANRPFQISVTPGLSSHGAMSSQVVNKLSLNLAGGYTAGVDGLELGGLFNINKRDTKYLQLAGVFNLVGGTMTGLQLAGVSNQALDTVKGIQVSGFINTAENQVSGLQLSALNNRAHKLKGVQIGLVNQADTSEGVSIGLINIIRNGFYKVSYSANNLMNTNFSIATGTHRFYTKFSIGANIWPNKQMYGFGLGAGHDFLFSNKIYLTAEVGYMFMNTGVWADRWIYSKLLLNAQLSKKVSVFAGPSYNRYANAQGYEGEETKFKKVITYPKGPFKKFGGWEAGIAYQASFKPSPKVEYTAKDWYLGARVEGGLGLGYQTRKLAGIHVFTERDLGRHLQATLSAGYTVLDAKARIPLFYTTDPEAVLGDPSVKARSLKLILLKAGVKSYLTNRIFFAGELGILIPLSEDKWIYDTKPGVSIVEPGYSPKSLLYALSAGYSFPFGIEAAVKFEQYVKYSGIENMSLGLSYRFKL